MISYQVVITPLIAEPKLMRVYCNDINSAQSLYENLVNDPDIHSVEIEKITTIFGLVWTVKSIRANLPEHKLHNPSWYEHCWE